MDFKQYRDLKKAAPAPGEVKPAGLSPLPAAPPTLGPLHCNGLGQTAPVVGGSFRRTPTAPLAKPLRPDRQQRDPVLQQGAHW